MPPSIAVHRRFGPAEHGLEHQEQHDGQHHEARTPDAAAARRCARSSGFRCGGAVAHGREHAAQVGLGLLGVFGAWRSCHAGAATLRWLVQRAGSMASMSASAPPRFTATVGTTGTPSSLREPRDVDVHAAARGDVHVERQHHRQAEALHLEREAQAEPQVDRVDDAHHESGAGSSATRPEQHVARDRFVERRRASGCRCPAGRGCAARGRRARRARLRCARR